MRVVVGVDPGGRESGVVLRRGGECHYAAVVTREDDQGWRDYVVEIEDTIDRAAVTAVDSGWGPPEVIGVEDVTVPNPHLGTISVAGILDTARVIGGLLVGTGPRAYWSVERLVLVPPSGHGMPSRADQELERLAYLREHVTRPINLWDEKAEPRGAGLRRHVRSAWDVARDVL